MLRGSTAMQCAPCAGPTQFAPLHFLCHHLWQCITSNLLHTQSNRWRSMTAVMTLWLILRLNAVPFRESGRGRIPALQRHSLFQPATFLSQTSHPGSSEDNTFVTQHCRSFSTHDIQAADITHRQTVSRDLRDEQCWKAKIKRHVLSILRVILFFFCFFFNSGRVLSARVLC